MPPIFPTSTLKVLNDPLYMEDNIADADIKIVSSFGYAVHQNDRTRLDGGITDDKN